MLNVTVKTETFETTTEPWTKGARKNTIENVQASAVRTKDGKVIVKLVNATEKPQAVSLNLNGPVQRIVFTGNGRDDHNTPFAPETLKEWTDEIELEGPLTLAPLSLTILSTKKER